MRRPLLAVALLLSAACGATADSNPEVARQNQALRKEIEIPDPTDPGGVLDPGDPFPPPVQRRFAPTPVVAPRTSVTVMPPTFVNDEVVGMVPGDQSCPAGNASWHGGDLFPVFVPSREGERFCAYTWQGQGQPTSASLPAYCPSNNSACTPCPVGWSCDAPAAGETWLEPNHLALTKAGLPADVNDVVARNVRAQHLAAIGAPASMPALSALPAQTRVVILDDHALHGDTVERWILETACPAGACNITVDRRDVFAASDVTSSLHLAREIVSSVTPVPGVAYIPNTVINISAGFYWEHAWTSRPNVSDDVSGAEYRIVHKALLAALNYAGCQGAVTVAAAGNRDGGKEQEDPGSDHFGGSTSFPAAFAPVQGWTCSAVPEGANRTVIHAVSSIRANGARAPSARQHGQACLVAPGLALTPEDGPLEGTSFATATMTGTVAAAWSYMPSFGISDVMGAVRERMPTTGSVTRADSCSFGDYTIKRVHLCEAVKSSLHRTCELAQTRVCARKEKPGLPRCLRADDPLRQPDACTAEAQLSCSAIPFLQDDLKLSSADSETLFLAARDPARKIDRTFTAGGLPPLPQANLCGFISLASDPDDRNSFTCPFNAYDNGQPEPERLSRSPTEPGCGACSVLMAQDRSLWLIGAGLDAALTSPAVRLSVKTPPLVVPGASTLIVPQDQVYELGESLLASTDSFSIKLSDPLPADTSINTAEFSFMLSDQSEAAFAHNLPVFVAGSSSN